MSGQKLKESPLTLADNSAPDFFDDETQSLLLSQNEEDSFVTNERG